MRKDAFVNEKWLHDRITEDPQIIGLGELRVLAREKAIPGGARLDILLFDDDNSRRYEVEIQFQLDALAVVDNLLLNFTHVLDQTELRNDDTEEEEGGG